MSDSSINLATAASAKPALAPASSTSVPAGEQDVRPDPFGDDLDKLLGELRDLALESREFAKSEDEPRIRSLYARDAANLANSFGKVLLLRGKHRKVVREEP